MINNRLNSKNSIGLRCKRKVDGIFTLVVMDVLSDDDDVVVFCFSMLEYPLTVVEHFVVENFAE
jgi:hypothetical protein